MKNRAPLALIEQAVMLLVFAMAAVLCLRVFLWADTQSRASAARDQALLRAQSAAEVLKGSRGDLDTAISLNGGTQQANDWLICYDEQWSETDGEPAYLLCARTIPAPAPLLGGAVVEVTDPDNTQLALLTVYWQEVVNHE